MKGNLMGKSKSGHSRVTWTKSSSCIPLVTSVKMDLPKGGTGKRCDYVDTERFLKDKRCIIQIQNKDDMCCARAIVTAKAKIDGHEQWNSIQRGRRIQEELALELHAKVMAYVVASVFFVGVITFVTVCTEVDATQEGSHAGNRIVMVVMVVQVDLLLGCGSMVNDSVEMITHVSLPKGGTGKICDYVDTERFLKDKRCIIQIQNKDDMCCARART
jgi:hypothetical protein